MTKRIAIVTGAGSGIGRAVALALLNDGYGVALAGRRPEPLEETAAAAKAGEALIVPTDVADPASVAGLIDTVSEKFGRLDTLFNNAGAHQVSTNFGDLKWEDWRRVLSVNLDGMFLCAQAAFQMMRDQRPQGGRIINNGSISAQVPRPGSAAYTASKHAVTGLTKTIALDGRAFDIACSQIDIGNTETPMTVKMTNGIPQPNGSIMVEPVMDVANVANTVLLMANMPLDANVQFATVVATKMPYLGRG